MRPTTPFQTGQLELHPHASLRPLFFIQSVVRSPAFLGLPFQLHEVRVQHIALEGARMLVPVGVFEEVGPMAGSRLQNLYSASGPLVLIVVRKTKDEGVFNILLQKFPREHNCILVAVS